MIRHITYMVLFGSFLAAVTFLWPDPTYTPTGDEWCYYDRFSTIEQMHWHMGDENRMIVVIPNRGVEVYLRCE